MNPHLEQVTSNPEDGASDPRSGEDDRAYRVAFERALRLLGQREHSRRELLSKLTGRGVDESTAELVIDDLRGRGLQSDERFAESFVYSRIGRGHGPMRIRRDLAQRGIADELADDALGMPGSDWLTLAVEVRRRRFGDQPPEGRDAWNRQARFLAQRGFPSDLIYQVLGQAD